MTSRIFRILRRPGVWMAGGSALVCLVVFFLLWATGSLPLHSEGGESSPSPPGEGGRFAVTGNGGDTGAVSLTVNEATDDGGLTLHARWSNLSGETVTLGEPYTLETLDGGAWIPCAPRGDLAFKAIAYLLNAGDTLTHDYAVGRDYVLETGTYRLIAEYSPPADGTSSAVWVEFAYFSAADVEAATQAARDYFSRETPARKLESLWFDPYVCVKARQSYLENGKGRENGADASDVLVLLCNYSLGKGSGGAMAGQYDSWQLIMLRDPETGVWSVNDQGFA